MERTVKATESQRKLIKILKLPSFGGGAQLKVVAICIKKKHPRKNSLHTMNTWNNISPSCILACVNVPRKEI